MCPAIVSGMVTRDGMVSNWPITESFRFKDKDGYVGYVTRTTFNFKFSRLFSKIDTPESFIVPFFTTKVSRLISVEGG